MLEKLKELLEKRDFPEIKKMLEEMNPMDIAAILAETEYDQLPMLFRLLPKELAADTFVELSPEMQQHLIASFDDAELKSILDDMFLDDTVDLIEEMPAGVVKRLLAQSTPIKRKLINELLKYPEDSAGSIMTVEFVGLKPGMTVLEAFDKIRKTGINKETIYSCYVTDEKRTLIGMVSARTLLLSDKDAKISDIMEENVISVGTLDDKEEAARKISKYGFLAMPVVDKEDRLVGIITVDDAMEVIEEENAEDFSKMAAISHVEESYFKTSVWKHSASRIVWLLILMLSATFTGMVLEGFENVLNAVPLLVTFIPMLMDTGGNCGSQASTTIIRGLSVGEIKTSDFLKCIFKEARIGIICSVLLALANTVRIIAMYIWRYDPALVLGEALVVGLTLIVVVMLSKLLGASLPILAKLLKLDPALLASPIITTIVDVAATLVFFAFSVSILPLFGISVS